MKTLAALFVLFFCISKAQAHHVTVCKMDKGERKIEVTTPDETKKLPCTVNYQRENEESRALWNAENDPNFCDEKARELADKLTAAGYECTTAPHEGSAEAAPPEKMTEPKTAPESKK